MNGRAGWIAGTSVCLLICAGQALYLGPARATGVDTGLLYLAGATALWNGEPVPFTQRAPLYSGLLALIGVPLRAGDTPSRDDARQYGGIERIAVADGFRTPSYLRRVTSVQALLFAFSAVFTAATLRMAGISGLWCTAAAAAGLLSPVWFLTGDVHDHTLDLFLLTAGICALMRSWVTQESMRSFAPFPLAVAGICLALAALSRPTFQLVTPLVAACLALLAGACGRRPDMRAALFLLVPWVLLVGGWSFRNQTRNGFFGVSSSLGMALGAKASPFLERAAPAFPDEVRAFLPIRDERLVNSQDHVGNNWADAGGQWLMRNRGMRYLEADGFLARVGWAAIRAAPLRYLRTVAASMTDFHWPYLAGPRALYLPYAAYEFLLVGAYLAAVVLWAGYHGLGRLIFHRPLALDDSDVVVALAAGIVLYTMAVSCLVDNSDPLHRMSVQFFLPMAAAAAGWRLQKARSK